MVANRPSHSSDLRGPGYFNCRRTKRKPQRFEKDKLVKTGFGKKKRTERSTTTTPDHKKTHPSFWFVLSTSVWLEQVRTAPPDSSTWEVAWVGRAWTIPPTTYEFWVCSAMDCSLKFTCFGGLGVVAIWLAPSSSVEFTKYMCSSRIHALWRSCCWCAETLPRRFFGRCAVAMIHILLLLSSPVRKPRCRRDRCPKRKYPCWTRLHILHHVPRGNDSWASFPCRGLGSHWKRWVSFVRSTD